METQIFHNATNIIFKKSSKRKLVLCDFGNLIRVVGKNTSNWSYWTPVSLKMRTKNQDKNSTQRKHPEKQREKKAGDQNSFLTQIA